MKMDLNNFASWCNTAKTGDSIIYHKGYLAKDRGPLTVPAKKQSDLSWVAAHALAESDAGKLALTQRRNGDFDYDYIATKRRLKVVYKNARG